MELGRTADLARAVPSLSNYLNSRGRASRCRLAITCIFAAELAHGLAGRPDDVRLWARASNATLKHPIGAVSRP